MDQQVTFSSDYLKCPITYDYFENPVQTSCCGKWISQDAFIQSFDLYGNCPLCKLDLDTADDPRNLPIIKDLQYLCEEAKKNHYVYPTPSISQKNAIYSAQVHCLTNNVSGSMIGKLVIKSSKKLDFKTLLIPVLDKSGSMAGGAFNQCKYSMERLINHTYQHKHLLTNIITYSDNATSLQISTTSPESYYKNLIAGWSASGGTSFSAAFNEIVKVLEKYSQDSTISSAIVVFLTDGEDSSVSKGNRAPLVTNLREQIKKVWTKNYDVHTIGFGSSHDSDFLDNLRKIDISKEGAYRYANPNEDTDSLSVKINSILDVVTASMIIPIQIVKSDLKIIGGEHTEYWVRLTSIDCNYPRTITINISGEEHSILLSIDEDQNDLKIWDQWYNTLTDKIVEELITIPKLKSMPLEHQLHLELLDQRTKSIMMKLDSENDTYKRLEKIAETIKIVQAGDNVDMLKMNDLKFEGRFKSVQVDKLSCNVKSLQKDVEYIPKVAYIYKKSYNFIDKTRVRRFDFDDENLIKLFGNSSTGTIMDSVLSDDTVKYCRDLNGSNILVFSSAIGRARLVERLLAETKLDGNEQNSAGYNAVDLAIMFGWQITTNALLNAGFRPSSGKSEQLFLTCVKNNYFLTADVMIKYNLVEPVESMIRYFYNQDQIEFIANRLVSSVSLETAITKGIISRVEQLLPTIESFSWKPYYEIFQKSTTDHIRIFTLLVDSGKANPFEEFTLPVQYENGTSFEESVWPLFLACRRGQFGMFSQIINYYLNPAELNKRNNNGNTCLWIACDGAHVDIVTYLLGYGVDPNVQNNKGDSALIPACQKGNETIVKMLLESGARLDAYNLNRDNPILICCRCGQAKVLELLFNHVTKDDVEKYLITYADIDGFVPLHASTELDKLECIKTCIKFGADIEHKTADDNAIIKGATALHLACHYGRLNSVMVLVSLGANVKAVTNVEKQTPLHIAIAKGKTNVVRYLLSLESGKECLKIEDIDKRLPIYYANRDGNDKILEEFFTNKLDKLLCNVLISHPTVEKLCSQVLSEYGESPLCYEYDGITSNQSILVNAMLNGNQHLIQAYTQINNTQQVDQLLLKNDEFGIPPIFWLNYLGYDMTKLQLCENTHKDLTLMFDRLTKVKSLGMQNKMLCHLQPTSHKLLESGVQPSIQDKQNSGIDVLIHDNVIANLRKSSSIDYSLLGFMDKLKNSKVFPDGEHILQYIMLDAKYNVIRRVVSGETVLQPFHMMALYLYTAHYDIFKQVNMVLKDLNETNFWFPFVNTLYKAIEMIEPFEGEVYRSVNSKFDLSKYAIGNTLRWNYFSIASSEYANSADRIEKKSGIIFVIKSKTGKKIGRYSKYPVDCEVVFLPSTTFVIKNYYISNIVCLGQANIRNTTFRIKESDIKKALAGEASIIIELEELV